MCDDTAITSPPIRAVSNCADTGQLAGQRHCPAFAYELYCTGSKSFLAVILFDSAQAIPIVC